MWLPGDVWLQGGMHGCGGHVWLQGVCMVVGGLHAWLPGGMHGSGGVCVVAGEGACMVAGGCMWLQGVCMVAGGRVWLLGVHGCGEHVWLQGGMVAGGACIGYDEIWSMSGWHASYWNAF